MSTKSRTTVKTNVTEFRSFFNGWLVRQQNYLQELRSTLRTCDETTSNDDDDLRGLIARVLAHYQQYYEQKSRIANHDVSLVFSPPWFSSFERSFFWIAGFKPGLAFRIVMGSVPDMDQEERMERLKSETKMEEKELEKEMAKVQESVAAPPIVEFTRGEISIVDGKYDEMETAIEALRGEMEVVLGNADMLRTRTAERVVEILTPVQNIKFLTAVTELQMKIRMWGQQIDGDTPR
ncbi:protein ZW2-like isoform X2 [Rutidosis leptorrhynchoides]|uniref:protein ZW2-like isoform X2 n=1 Tax=Rutidosis leptorrhynchoides TaxID=125765 RepID=UPI003A995C6B